MLVCLAVATVILIRARATPVSLYCTYTLTRRSAVLSPSLPQADHADPILNALSVIFTSIAR